MFPPSLVDSALNPSLAFASLPISQFMPETGGPQEATKPKAEPSGNSPSDRLKSNESESAGANGSSPEANQASSSKRKLEDTDNDDPHNKIRRVARDQVVHDTRISAMTTVICLHAAVAQKSYGTEKRFLCPPPVVHIEGPTSHLRSQNLSMVVVSETGERSFEQKAPLDTNMTCSFKFLHVGGTAKAKSFQLSLEVSEPSTPPAGASDESDPPPGRVWASFDSAPVSIISKPSKKTAKTRNIASCILAGGPVSLFNRINSQTVRTKYMTIDNTQLCASNTLWSAFNVNVVRRPSGSPPAGGPQPVTYGCEILLSDTHSGVTTSSLIIRKVDKGRVSTEDGGPVSQMQKIVLQKINPDGSRHYLSASTPMNGNVASSPTGSSGTHPLLFQSARTRNETKDGIHTIFDEVDDYLCWTIVGISKFQYTFFDAFNRGPFVPTMPMTPFPTLFSAPIYRAPNNTLELTASHFFYEHPAHRGQVPLDVYLGSLGPLRQRLYQANPPGPLTRIQTYPLSCPTDDESTDGSTSLAQAYLTTAGNTVIIVDLPPLNDIVKALKDSESSETDENGTTSTHNGDTPRVDVPSTSFLGRTLPLLFIRSADGVGYHSGRTIACENMFHPMPLPDPAMMAPNGQTVDTGWLVAQAAASTTDGPLHGWTLRVM
jgi:recombining binding protein (suppressor of hairless)